MKIIRSNKRMFRQIRAVGLLSAMLALTSCDDLAVDPEDIGEFTARAEFVGIPQGGGTGVLVEWESLEHDHYGARNGLTPDLPIHTWQAPVGETRIEVLETPQNCTVTPMEETFEVQRDEVVEIVFDVICE